MLYSHSIEKLIGLEGVNVTKIEENTDTNIITSNCKHYVELASGHT